MNYFKIPNLGNRIIYSKNDLQIAGVFYFHNNGK